MNILKGISKRKCIQSKKQIFLYNTFLNKGFSHDTIGKHIKMFTLILTNILEGILSHFLDEGLFLCHVEVRLRLFLTICTFFMIQIQQKRNSQF